MPNRPLNLRHTRLLWTEPDEGGRRHAFLVPAQDYDRCLPHEWFQAPAPGWVWRLDAYGHPVFRFGFVADEPGEEECV